MNIQKVVLYLLLTTCFLHTGFAAGESHAWWNDQWKYRKKITLNTSATGGEIQSSLADFPLLLRLHSANLTFVNVKETGEDIRFVAADDKTLLKHHMEQFDGLGEMALAWVKVPSIAGNSPANSIWMYYGNQDAAGAEDMKGTYEGGFVGVYHFNQIEGIPQDASSYGNNAAEFTAAMGLPGVIGNGATFSGAGDRMRIADSPSLNFSSGFTISTWFKLPQLQKDAYLFFKGSDSSALLVGTNGNDVFCRLTISEKKTLETITNAELTLDTWHHLAVTGMAGGKLQILIDGIDRSGIDLPPVLPEIKGDVFIGSAADGSHGFAGDLDELKISAMGRTPDWSVAGFRSQGPEAALASFDLEEVTESGGMPVFYLATVFKNITLDGLVIIGMLMILALFSWIIMISKAAFLWLLGSDNAKFRDLYRQAEDVATVPADKASLSNSSFFRIYRGGMDSIKAWFGESSAENPWRRPLTVKEIKTFKNALEKGLIEEARRMNTWLIVLIMSISGGPFLGLLGTVWGVMNTFAAMAEAGEANIAAIAPGVASALATTVFGLIVAIPALFGYNFLAGRIKDITAEMAVFVDDLALTMENRHAE
ncbi:MAG: DUF2341 domain-containing protein [Pseudomonadota bacterium]